MASKSSVQLADEAPVARVNDSCPDGGTAKVLGLSSALLSVMHSHPLTDQEEITQLEDVSAALAQSTSLKRGPARVVCVGRTKAGKSTLRYVLTGEGEAGIGLGGQRTTRESIEYVWQGHTLVDTPGVGALDGSDDVGIARAAAKTADLILFVITSDGLQQATVKPLQEILHIEAPVLILYNHKRVFRDDQTPNLTRAHVITEVDSRESRLRSVFNRASLEVAHAQLDLARRGRDLGMDSLLDLSQIEEFEALLDRKAREGVRLRPETRARQIACRIEAIGQWLDHSEESSTALLAVSQEMHDEALGEAEKAKSKFEDGLQRSVAKVKNDAISKLRMALEVAKRTEHQDDARAVLADSAVRVLHRLRRDLRSHVLESLNMACESHGLSKPGLTADDIDIDSGLPIIRLEGHPRRARRRRLALLTTTAVASVPTGGGLAMITGSAVVGGLLGSPEIERKKRITSVQRTSTRLFSAIEARCTQANQEGAAQFDRFVRDPLMDEVAGHADLVTIAKTIEDSRRALGEACS